MSSQANRRVLTVLLVFGAVVFGMVLSGSLNLTTPGASDTEPEHYEPSEAELEHWQDMCHEQYGE